MGKAFITSLSPNKPSALREALRTIHSLQEDRPTLMGKLVEANLVVDDSYRRKPSIWADLPPERGSELGIGGRGAW